MLEHFLINSHEVDWWKNINIHLDGFGGLEVHTLIHLAIAIQEWKSYISSGI
jgi:hypothetical protein